MRSNKSNHIPSVQVNRTFEDGNKSKRIKLDSVAESAIINQSNESDEIGDIDLFGFGTLLDKHLK